MAHIKLIDETTDLSQVSKPIGWDLEVNGVPYDVYRIDGYNHTLGGKFSENCYWACPAGERPTYKNLIEFNGDAPTWGVVFDRSNYIKTKWDETSVECNGSCWITRNGKKFYRVSARYMDYGLASAQHILVNLLEGPLNLSERDWKEQTIGRKIWYENQPARITRINDENELWIEPDGIPCFKAPAHGGCDDYSDYENGLRVDLLSPDIYWYRD
ncbi:hypothetical protein PDM95_00865 [Bacillus cereus]|nr:hypothetical protein [Bacillus cereus]